MRLLIITQKADSTDPILGFFHRWMEGFAKECETVTVIAQYEGVHALPANVEVHSLGKERRVGKWRQILRFWFLIWRLSGQYDAVFVHMTPIWVVLGGPLWKVMRKPIYLWYEVRRGGRILRMALRSVKRVFSATDQGVPFPTPKNFVVGHGIDTVFFRPGTAPRDERLLLTVGRVTPIKRFDLLLAAFAELPSEYRLLIGGGPVLPSDQKTLKELQAFIAEKGMADRVEIRFLTQAEVVASLQKARLFLHAAGGGLDKVVLEAMACGCPVLTASGAAADVLPAACRATEDTLVQRLRETLAMQPEDRTELEKELRSTIEQQHDLPHLIRRLVEDMQ